MRTFERTRFSKLHFVLFSFVFSLIGIFLYLSLAAPNPNLTGDLNNDGKVDGADLSVLATYWHTNNPAADITKDNYVDLSDLAQIILNFGKSSSGGGGSPNLTVDGTWENGLGTFTGVECPNPSTQFAIVNSPVREGTHAAYVHETPADIWSGNNIVRCLHADYNSGETVGNDYYYRLSMYLPQHLNGNLIWELHHPSSLYNLSGCGVAPFAINSNGTGLTFRISTGNCTVGSGYAEWEPNIPIPNLTSQPLNTWIDFAIHIKFTEANAGMVEVYDRIGNGAWGLQITRSNIPTMPFCNSPNVHSVVLYTEMGLYVGATGYTNTDTIYLDDYHRESSLSAVENY